jgi:hypothetical protein
MSKYVKAYPGPNYSVIYRDDQGKRFLFSGGTWAWRNQNPGNLRPGGISKRKGQIGISLDQQSKPFAIFRDLESGYAALGQVLMSQKYQEKSLDDAIATYAPSSENDTKRYQAFVRKKLQLRGAVKLKALSSQEFSTLLEAIQTVEGYKPGKVELIPNVEAVEENKKGATEGYFCPPLGWLRKVEAIDLAEKQKINGTVCRPKKNPAYLRASLGEKAFHELPKKTSV